MSDLSPPNDPEAGTRIPETRQSPDAATVRAEAARLRRIAADEAAARAEEDTAASPAPIETLERLRDGGGGVRYRLGEEIARGGMGAIVRVWDHDLRRNLAMKVMLDAPLPDAGPERSRRDQRIVARFLEEAQITGQLDHPGIVPVHELGMESGGRLWFTMQLVRGRDLQKIYRLVREEREGWSQTRALGVLLKACEAMAYAHSKGVVHRDLKPANVMVGRFGEVYVMDWGVARVLGQKDSHDLRLRTEEGRAPSSDSGIHLLESQQLLTRDGDVVGTPSYIAPEQARGELDRVGPRSDVYSVGAMLYQLLTAHVPYVVPGGRDSTSRVLARLFEGPPTPVHELSPAVPPELVAICEKAMARELDERYASMEELADDLRAYLEHRVVRAYETGAWAELRKWVVRNKPLAASAAATILVALAGLGATGYVQAAGRRAADVQREVAQAERDKVLRLADEKRLRDLRASAAELWPATPARVPDYRDWLRRAEELAQRVDLHRGALADLRALSAATAEESWQAEVLTALVAELEAFARPATGDVARLRERLAFAETVAERSTDGPAARAAWDEASASIADRGACPAYDGLELEPQLGLLPIGRDPASGLWEFAHLQTGAPAARNADGGLVMAPETGLVFVLVPGGTFTMGAQPVDRDASNFDPAATGREGPPLEVELAPFFLSKFEMTQAQWERFTGDNPSNYRAGKTYALREVTPTHPVELVSWDDCARVLGRLGLELPTEARWEYAARAGTSSPWYAGDSVAALQGHANVADAYARRAGVPWPEVDAAIDDGYATHAPVGTYRANAFGLHDVHGNVWEWCADAFTVYADGAPRAGDGLREDAEDKYRVFRGGSFANATAFARSSWRNSNTPDYRDSPLGLRPARGLD